MKNIILNILFFVLISAVTISAQTKVGTTAANFLTIPVGARATGMGGAFVAVAEDASSGFWNPAGLARLEGNQINISHTPWLVSTNHNWVSLSIGLGDNTFGISVNQLDYGSEEITTPDDPMGTGQRWEAMDIAVGLIYSRNITDNFSFGAAVKYVEQKIWHESAVAVAMDVGLLYQTEFSGLTIGMNISNFGTEIEMEGKDLLQPVDIDPGNSGNNDNIVSNLDTDSWPLPLAFTVGIGVDIIKSHDWQIILAMDATHPNNQKLFLNTGTEISWSEMFFIRAGYNSLFKEEALEGLSLGMGVYYPIGNINLAIDYSYMDYGIFDSISRYSINIGF